MWHLSTGSRALPNTAWRNSAPAQSAAPRYGSCSCSTPIDRPCCSWPGTKPGNGKPGMSSRFRWPSNVTTGGWAGTASRKGGQHGESTPVGGRSRRGDRARCRHRRRYRGRSWLPGWPYPGLPARAAARTRRAQPDRTRGTYAHRPVAGVPHRERGTLLTLKPATLRAYVEALGGHLRITADFGDETLSVTDDASACYAQR